MKEFGEWLLAHWEFVALAITWTAFGLTSWRRRGRWRRKEFDAQVNFSLNYLVNGQLTMRTLLEIPAHEVWLNVYGASLVAAAARRTTQKQPFVLLDDATDSAFVNRAVLNVLSERFASAYLAASLGAPVVKGEFVFALTYERYAVMRTRKLRVLVVEKDTLIHVFGNQSMCDDIRVDSGPYRARLATLRQMSKLYQQDVAEKRPQFGVVEIGVSGS